jgi:hypothetical protein
MVADDTAQTDSNAADIRTHIQDHKISARPYNALYLKLRTARPASRY